MEALTGGQSEVLCQLMVVGLVSTVMCKLAVSSWLIGRVEEMAGDKKNLFRLDALGSSLRKEMLITLVYQSLSMLHLPNMGTYMVEKGFIPKAAAKNGIKPQGRIWWVKIENNEVVSRKLLENNGPLATFRKYPKESYTNPQGDLAAEILICGENVHESLAPDGCFSDTEVGITITKSNEENGSVETKSKIGSAPGFKLHAGVGQVMLLDEQPGEAGDRKSFRSDHAYGMTFKQIFDQSGRMIDYRHWGFHYRNLKDFFQQNRGVILTDDGNRMVEREADAAMLARKLDEFDAFTTSARLEGKGGAFRTEAWDILSQMITLVYRMKLSCHKGVELAIKFESFRSAVETYCTIAEHRPGSIEDHNLLVIKSDDLATLIGREATTVVRASAPAGTRCRNYRKAVLSALESIEAELGSKNGMLNPSRRVRDFEHHIRECMAGVIAVERSEIDTAYRMYEQYLKAKAEIERAEAVAMRDRRMDADIAISIIDMTVT